MRPDVGMGITLSGRCPLTTIRIQESNLGWFVYDYENYRILADGLTKTEALAELARLVNEAHEEAR